MLLTYVGSVQILRLWNLQKSIKDVLDERRLSEYKQQGKVLDDFWRRINQGEGGCRENKRMVERGPF